MDGGRGWAKGWPSDSCGFVSLSRRHAATLFVLSGYVTVEAIWDLMAANQASSGPHFRGARLSEITRRIGWRGSGWLPYPLVARLEFPSGFFQSPVVNLGVSSLGAWSNTGS